MLEWGTLIKLCHKEVSNRRKKTSGGGGEETGRTNDTYIMYVYVIIKELKKLSKKVSRKLAYQEPRLFSGNSQLELHQGKEKNWRVSLEEYLPKKVCSEVQTEHDKKLG